MIRAIIIDDELHCINRLTELVKPLENVTLVGAYTSVEEGSHAILALAPDLIFLDVQINDKTGFDLLEKVGKKDFEVIFTTAFDTYAVLAFKFSAVDYLLKPIDADDLIQALEKVNEKLDKKDFEKKVETLLSNLNKKDIHKRISIPTSEGLIFIEVSEIVRCQSDVNYTNIFLNGNKKITVSKTLKSFEALLSNCNFFRIHNSHLINLECISKYTKGKGGYVTLVDGTYLEVSTRRKEEFLKRLAH
ncbi:LytTR family DNA-binding domain-containing protein [Arenibacter sp. F26102]|uniref:LytR/AlgR family response regulator transcription factor n=1 Tax=Arenibacter sp. F26102 TaxID=2926416 RepID=UPI001FF22BBA|nr:LytTR family DNA-binding domain-containing protein [Arenibacter sp. F26102]MCK0147641.1 LytTR family DNA-binding domain-containing protein [Arenibacter sp. F26102]